MAYLISQRTVNAVVVDNVVATTCQFFAQNIEVPEDIEKEFMNMAATKGFGIIKTMVNSPDMKFEPANIVFRFPEDDEV